MANGGETASRGFIFQAVIALIECLDPEREWDRIKNEPKTEEDKVDIMLYKDGRTISAIQVKSSINRFERADVKKWLERLKKDARDAEKVCLCLVGDRFTPSCQTFIEETGSEIKTVSFQNLQRESTFRLIEYIRNAGLGGKVRIDDLDLIDAGLFSGILRNSTAQKPVSRKEFEEIFQRAIPQGEELAEQIAAAVSGQIQKVPGIPQCLTPIPPIDKETGLVGRGDVVKEIRSMLEENTCIVLVNGLGGIGKTAVMQGICNELKGEGNYVAWIRCGDSLHDDLLTLRDAFKVPKEEKADEAYRIVKAGIQQLGRKLYLFMDDLSREVTREERDTINGFGVHVMITSRAENLPFPKKKLEYLDEDSAVKMFRGYYGGETGDEVTLRKIILSVRCHTLLVELLAKAAREEGGTLGKFNKKLEDGLFFVSEEPLDTEHDDENRTIEESVIRLYEISGLSKEQQRIMKLFTIFSPEKEIYYEVRDWAGFDRAELRKLVERGWLERGGLEQGYQIHQIVRDSIAGQMEKKGDKVRLEEYGEFLDRVINTDGYLGREITYDKVRERLVLTEDVAGYFDKVGRVDSVAAALFNNMAGVLREQGNYVKSLNCCEKALVICEQGQRTDHLDMAATYHNLAMALEMQGEFEKSLEYCKKALAIRERVQGLYHLDTVATYHNMAGVFYAKGEYEKALENYGKVLVIREKLQETGCRDTAATYNNMGLVYFAQGNYKKALEYYRKAFEFCEQVLGREHPDTAATYNNMAMVFHAQGEYEKALEHYGKALAIRERVSGTNHPDTAITYDNMAKVFHELGEHEKALEYYGKALAIRERVLGPNHPYIAAVYNNIAVVFCEQGEYVKALENFGKDLTISERVLGRNHPDTATTYDNMAKVFHELGEHEKALEYYGKALAIRERVLGADHFDTATTYNSMAVVFRAQGKYGKSLEYYGKALATYEQVLGDHPETAATCNAIAVVLHEQGIYVKALKYYRKALTAYKHVLGSNHPYVATTYNNMARVFDALGDYDKALDNYGKALAICEQILGPDHLDTATTYNNMAVVFRKRKNYGKALENYEKALAIVERMLGPNHPKTAITYNNMAGVFDAQGEYQKALEYYKKAYAVFLLEYGENHPYTQDAKVRIMLIDES